MDHIEREVVRFRAQADQLREGIRTALRELEPEVACDLFRTCARGDLAGLDERMQSLVAWLALTALVDMGERREEGRAER